MDIKIEILHNNKWHDISIENLRKGNIIRVYKDGELVTDTYGYTGRQCRYDVKYDKELENCTIESFGVKLDENNNVIKINK